MTWRPGADEDGVTLVEVVVTVVIMAIALVAVIEGMRTSIFASDLHRKEANAEVVTRVLAEAVKAAPYSSCASAVTTTTTPAFTEAVTAIAAWDANTNTWKPCPATDSGLQRVSIRVASTDGRDTEVLDVVKRKS